MVTEEVNDGTGSSCEYTRIQQAGSVARNLVLLEFAMKKRNRGQTILGLKPSKKRLW
jgi:hypothetical protein